MPIRCIRFDTSSAQWLCLASCLCVNAWLLQRNLDPLVGDRYM